MKQCQRVGGRGTIADLNQLEAWEANLICNLRMWCDGPCGQIQVRSEYQGAESEEDAGRECRVFQTLQMTVLELARRPLVRHEIGYACVGVDESFFINASRTASDRQHTDAGLIASSLIGSSLAEHDTVMVGQVVNCAHKSHSIRAQKVTSALSKIVRIH